MFGPSFFACLGISAVVSYLLGSCNFAIIVSHLYAREDVRSHGSGNAGMTNILRTYGTGPAIFTAVGDFAKALAAVLLTRFIFSRLGPLPMDPGYIAGLFVLLGHVYPLYFKFRGGKGVMTALGVILAVNPTAFAILAVIFVPFVFIVKIVSLASILGALLFPVITYLLCMVQKRPALYDTAFASVYAVFIIYLHRENIRRLLNGTENKFGKPKH